MKKKFGFLMSIVLLIGLLFNMASVSADDPGTNIFANVSYTYKAPTNGTVCSPIGLNFNGTINSAILDGNINTGQSHTTYCYFAKLNNVLNISVVRIVAARESEMAFYDETGAQIGSNETFTANDSSYHNVSYQNVKYIMYRPTSTLATNLYEIFAMGTDPASIPTAPISISAASGDELAVLNWSANTESDLASYRVYQDGVLIATVSAPSTTYTVQGLTNGTAYTYQVSAVNTFGKESAKSESVQVTPVAVDIEAPAAPLGLAGNAGYAQVSLVWAPSTAEDLAGYKIYQDGQYVTTVEASVYSYNVSNLTNGTTYTFEVSAVDAAGNESSKSNAVQVTPIAPDTEAPAVPLQLNGTAGDEQATLTWTANTEPDLAGYKVYQNGILVATVVAPATTWVATRLTNGEEYTYQVTAFDTAGNESAESNSVKLIPQPPTRDLLTIYLSNGQIKEYDLSWLELNAFLDWYDGRSAGAGVNRYSFTKTWNMGPYKSRVEYVLYDKIVNFDVDEYEVPEVPANQ